MQRAERTPINKKITKPPRPKPRIASLDLHEAPSVTVFDSNVLEVLKDYRDDLCFSERTSKEIREGDVSLITVTCESIASRVVRRHGSADINWRHGRVECYYLLRIA
jgi:hypothetical protein